MKSALKAIGLKFFTSDLASVVQRSRISKSVGMASPTKKAALGILNELDQSRAETASDPAKFDFNMKRVKTLLEPKEGARFVSWFTVDVLSIRFIF